MDRIGSLAPTLLKDLFKLRLFVSVRVDVIGLGLLLPRLKLADCLSFDSCLLLLPRDLYRLRMSSFMVGLLGIFLDQTINFKNNREYSL